MEINLIQALRDLLLSTGFATITYQQIIMLGVSFVLLYLAIVKGFEPLLLMPIAFGMLLANLPAAGMMAPPTVEIDAVTGREKTGVGGLLWYLYQGVKLGIYPPLIFLGVGAMTDFGPLIANPKTLLLGAAAQLGIFTTFIGALALGFNPQEASSIGIIGGADGPTAIFLTSKLAPHLLGAIAVAAYSYMALVPIIQPPIMRLLTTKKMRLVVMDQLRPVSKTERIVFPIAVTVIVSLLLPDAAPLVGMLMLGNLFRESGVVGRLSDTSQNAMINIVTIFLGTTVGATASAETFLDVPDDLHHPAGACGLLRGYCRRGAVRRRDVLHLRREGEPADRIGGRVGRAHGSPCLPGGGAARQPAKLPSDARHGAQRGRRHRLGRRGRRAAVVVQVTVRPVRESRRGEEKSAPCDLHFSSPGDCASFWRPHPYACGVRCPAD